MARNPKNSALGDFLRARRALADPEDVGISTTRRRRVTGLRREELARLAKISVPYYTRLEQGKHATASHAVLDSIATALRLPPADRAYLHRLAQAGDAGTDPPSPESTAAVETVRVLEALDEAPGILLASNMDIMAVNGAARALCEVAGDPRPILPNAIHWQLFNPLAQRLYGEEWAGITSDLIGMLRLHAGREPSHPGIRRVIDELADSSVFFRRVWSEHKVSNGIRRSLNIHQPGGTTREMMIETLSVAFAADQTMLVFTPGPH